MLIDFILIGVLTLLILLALYSALKHGSSCTPCCGTTRNGDANQGGTNSRCPATGDAVCHCHNQHHQNTQPAPESTKLSSPASETASITGSCCKRTQ